MMTMGVNHTLAMILAASEKYQEAARAQIREMQQHDFPAECRALLRVAAEQPHTDGWDRVKSQLEAIAEDMASATYPSYGPHAETARRTAAELRRIIGGDHA